MKVSISVVVALTVLCAPGASTTDAFVPRHPGRLTTSFVARGSTLASVQEVDTEPIPGMKPGTSGLRKKVEVWQGVDKANKYYVENFIQSLLDTAIARNDGKVPST